MSEHFIPTQRLLVPVDLSVSSEGLLTYARNFAKELESEVVLLYVVEPMIYPPEIIGGTDLNMLEVEKSAVKGAQKKMPELIEKYFSDVTSGFLIESGYAAQKIVEVAEREKADMIILSTHGYSGFKHMLMGSTAEKVVCHATCPVLTVRIT